MRDAENILAVERLGIDWLGFIFWPKSSRYVASVPSYLPVSAKRVGVFVDADIDDILEKVKVYQLDIIQLHGKESPDYIHALRTAYVEHTKAAHTACDSIVTPRLIKALSIKDRADITAYQQYEGLVDYFLFDTKGKSVGGNGTQFDWSVLTAYQGTTPFLLSGGIGPDDAPRLHALLSTGSSSVAAKCAGIDLNSRFELSPGLKDTAVLSRFLEELKAHKA